MNDHFAFCLSRPAQDFIPRLDVSIRTVNQGLNDSDVDGRPYEGFNKSQCEELCLANIDCVAFDYVGMNQSRACRFTTDVN